MPITIRNYVRGNDFVLIASQGGLNFFIGNNQTADGMTVRVPGVPPSIEGIYEQSSQLAEQATGQKMRPSEISDYYAGKAWAFMRDHPGREAALTLKKLRYFWSYEEILNNKNVYFLTQRYTPIIRYLPLGFWIVGPLGLMGLAASLWRWHELFPLISFVVVYMVSVVLFFVTGRFRLPMLPVLMLLGSFGVWQLIIAIYRHRWVKVSSLAVVLIAACWLVSLPAGGDARAQLADLALTDLAKVLHAKNRTDEALAMLDEAIAINPRRADALYSKAFILEDLGRLDEAKQLYQRTLAVNPRHVSAANNLGRIYLKAGDIAQAIPLLRRATEVDPTHASSRFNLGRALEQAGQPDEAVAMFREGLKLEPDRVDVLVQLANILAGQGRYRETVPALETALNYEPDNVDILVQLCRLRASVDDSNVLSCQQARKAGEHAVDLTGGHNVLALDALAAAYAECDQWSEAVETAGRACKLARDQSHTWADAICARRDQYQDRIKQRVSTRQ